MKKPAEVFQFLSLWMKMKILKSGEKVLLSFFFSFKSICCVVVVVNFQILKKKKTRGIWELLFFLSSKRCEYSAVKNKEWGKNPKRINANN